MDLHSALGRTLIFLGLCGICTGLATENCTNYKLQFERVFSVPGDVAMLKSSLMSVTTLPYNISWYNSKTGLEMNQEPGRILVHKDTLWFLNVALEDDGEYITVLRTLDGCYRQSTKLIVDQPVVGKCGKPKKALQTITKGTTDHLSCPLQEYITKLDSYNVTSSITWYRGCDAITDGAGRFTYRGKTKLKIDPVDTADKNIYTCTLSFSLGGITGSVSETIEVDIQERYSLVPQVHEPVNEIIQAEIGSNLSKRCLVFVPCVGMPFVDIVWMDGGKFILSKNPSDRVYTSEQRSWMQDVPHQGVWFEQLLILSEVQEEDFYINYTCRVYSSRGLPERYFTLLPPDPNIMIPIGIVFSAVTVLFISSVIFAYVFKVDIVLWFRRVFPVFYTNTDLDGKLYDAYVAYPSSCSSGYVSEVEAFAIQTMPQVLEKACGYKLFITDRDCSPGQAIVDSVEENLKASRRLLLLYTASTFTGKQHTSSTSSNNNNNISKSTDRNDNIESNTQDSQAFDDSEEFYDNARHQLECIAAMHRALLEGSLKVVLVEMEEITPTQLALFPESVRHLRKRQGAVCLWKHLRPRRRWKTCTSTRQDEEKGQNTQTSPPLSPNSRFWKEMRYHMPVRGKRRVYPEKTALL
ncbi:uncharacterized protein V6R79_008024 [Siganus canaliculatus]